MSTPRDPADALTRAEWLAAVASLPRNDISREQIVEIRDVARLERDLRYRL